MPIKIFGDGAEGFRKLQAAMAEATARDATAATATPESANGSSPTSDGPDPPLVIQLQAAEGHANEHFEFRDLTQRTESTTPALPIEERSRAVQEYRRSLLGKQKPQGGAQ